MDSNLKFKTIHVSIVQPSTSVVNSFTSSVELIEAMAHKLKRQNSTVHRWRSARSAKDTNVLLNWEVTG